jgi:hypothetical protein
VGVERRNEKKGKMEGRRGMEKGRERRGREESGGW